MARVSKQDSFATNLGGLGLGTSIYHPIQFREHSGRVGDIAFFDCEGNYKWLRNAFDTETIQLWNWPVFGRPETGFVVEEEAPQFKIAVGGSAEMVSKEGSLTATIPVSVAPVEAGGSFKIRVSKMGSSMSILVPGNDALRRRACVEQSVFDLLEWFATVEIFAWEAVNSYYSANRPNEIFFVLSQILTPEYAIGHKENSSSECEVVVEGLAQIPTILDTKALASYDIRRVRVSAGFEQVVRKSESDEKLFSIFLELHRSRPIKLLKRSRLFVRLQDMHKTFLKAAQSQAKNSGNGFRYVSWGNKVQQCTNDQVPQRVPMQSGDDCVWHLLKLSRNFAVQYTGENPSEHFPGDMEDDDLMKLIEGFEKVAQSQITRNILETPAPLEKAPAASKRSRSTSRSSDRKLRRLSLQDEKRPQSSGFQVPPVRPASCPPVQLEGDPSTSKSVAIKDLTWVRTRMIRKAPELFLSWVRNLFLARFVMRLVVCIGRYLLGIGGLWLSPSSLFVFWVVEYLILRRLSPNHLTFFGALWSVRIFSAGNSIWVGSISDILLFMMCTWAEGKVKGRFLTEADAAMLGQLFVTKEFWDRVFRSVFKSQSDERISGVQGEVNVQ